MTVQDGDVLRVVAKFNDGADEIQNVYHMQVQVTTPPTDAALASAMGDYMAAAYTPYQVPMTDNIFFTSVATYNETQNMPVGEVPWPLLVNGGQSANPLPPQNSPLVLFTTSVLNSLGKKFLPNLTVNSVDTDGTISTAALTAIVNFINILLNGHDGLTWSAGPGNYRSATQTFIPYIAGVARDFFATQRRRYFGKGS